jgi:hypothetical protein
VVKKWHDELATVFKAGNTNVPLLLVTDCCWTSYRVDRSGKSKVGVQSISVWSRDEQLGSAGRLYLIQMMNALPTPPTEIPPPPQQILISGLRSNQWFHGVFCRTNLPPKFTEFFKGIGHESLFR